MNWGVRISPAFFFACPFFFGTVTIMVLANALSYQNASGPFNNGPTELT